MYWIPNNIPTKLVVQLEYVEVYNILVDSDLNNIGLLSVLLTELYFVLNGLKKIINIISILLVLTQLFKVQSTYLAFNLKIISIWLKYMTDPYNKQEKSIKKETIFNSSSLNFIIKYIKTVAKMYSWKSTDKYHANGWHCKKIVNGKNLQGVIKLVSNVK